jgi:hypothetical protein
MKTAIILMSVGATGFVIGNLTGFKVAKVTIVKMLEERLPIIVKALTDSYSDLANGTITTEELQERLKTDMDFISIVTE